MVKILHLRTEQAARRFRRLELEEVAVERAVAGVYLGNESCVCSGELAKCSVVAGGVKVSKQAVDLGLRGVLSCRCHDIGFDLSSG